MNDTILINYNNGTENINISHRGKIRYEWLIVVVKIISTLLWLFLFLSIFMTKWIFHFLFVFCPNRKATKLMKENIVLASLWFYRHLFFFMLLFHCVLCIGNGVWLNFLRLACVFPLYAGTSFNSFSRGSFMSSCIDTFIQTLLNGRKRATRNQERLIFSQVNSTLLIIVVIFKTFWLLFNSKRIRIF